MTNKKNLIIALLAIAVIYVLFFFRMPGQTAPANEDSVNNTMPALDSGGTPETVVTPEVIYQ
ncbi:MAG TPA: hypothetical protein VJI33_05380 [Candidatus Paceibacterota bacterium]